MMPRSSISTFVLPLFFAFPSVLASTYQCTNFTIPVNVTAPSLQVAFPPFESHFDSIAFLLNLSSRNASSSSSSLFRGEANVTSTFNISSQYCIPANASSNDTGKVQVLTHGLGFNKDYWNFGGPGSQYNYIQAATNAGYSTFSYDRIGTGESSYPDPYDIAQGPTELVILATLTERLRLGLLAPHIPKPEKVLHVGHSFGSILIHGLAASAPNLTDGIVLTGYSTNGTWQTQWLVSTLFQLAKYHIPERFGNLSTGYLTWGGEWANQYGFFHYPNFDKAVLAAAEASKFPFAIGEVLTGALLQKPADNFVGPVLIISGLNDLIFCGADCAGVLEQAGKDFPKAGAFETYTQPDTGHALNLHYSATGTYGVITEFLAAHGL